MPLRKVVISGGGTGGHIFPAIAIANAIKGRYPNCEILFIGANGRMEMEKVPADGYDIIGLDIEGLKRRLTFKNLGVLMKFIQSAKKARKILKEFNPQIAIGVGGYASAPMLRAAAKLGIKTVIQEQNSYAGLTNKALGKKAGKVCVAYNGMDRFFNDDKLVLTGNPVRSDMVNVEGKRNEALSFFGLEKDKKTLLVLGGSQGAKTVNESIKAAVSDFTKAGIQVIWQCGKGYVEDLQAWLAESPNTMVKLHAFIQRMDLAYAAADMVVSRAGAISVSEICVVGKPAILVPSPNVAEDHQTKNAMALVEQNAAVLVTDAEARGVLKDVVLNLADDDGRRVALSESVIKMGKPDATEHIVNVIEKLLEK